jgi:hypothetical protein
MNAIEEKPLPAEIHTGIAVHVSDRLDLTGSLKQVSESELSYQAGFEYAFYSFFFLRCGFHTLPSSESFGAGLRLKNFMMDVGFETNPLLGLSSAISLCFLL